MEEKTKLEMCAEEIRGLEYTILNGETALAYNEEQAAFVLSDMKDRIANEMGIDGKPLYSNDVKRAAALQKMINSDKSYCNLLGQNKGDRHLLASHKIELNYQRNMFEVYKRVGQY